MSDDMVVIESGRQIEFPDGRAVFVANMPGHDLVVIGFRNKAGEITKLSLSVEAAKALADLISNPLAGVEAEPPKPRISDEWRLYKWKAVVKVDQP